MKIILSALLTVALLLSAGGCSQKTSSDGLQTVPVSAEQTADKEAAFKAEPAANRTILIGYDGGLCQAAIPVRIQGLLRPRTKPAGRQNPDNTRDALAGSK